MQQDNASWLDMPLLRWTEERGYILRDAEIVAQYVDVSSTNSPLASFYFVAFDKPFDWLNVYSHFGYWTKVTILERQLSSRGDSD